MINFTYRGDGLLTPRTLMGFIVRMTGREDIHSHIYPGEKKNCY